MRKGEMVHAYAVAGYRERYAMDNGNKSVRYEDGRTLWRFTYSKYKEYQDANGATYYVEGRRWVG